ncbi:MAG: hypothetical protein ACRDEA_16405 [Microcystaceae cyanobacterium]
MTHLGFDGNDKQITAIAKRKSSHSRLSRCDFQRIQQVRTLSLESWV